FNPLFPRGAYFGYAALIGPYNLIDIHPLLTLSFTKKVDFEFDYDAFWRYSQNDGLYGINGFLTYSGRNITSKYIGGQSAFRLSYDPNNFINLTYEITWFNAGDFLKAAGSGKDILFTGITAQLKF
ncbi:MAG TPA: alginate export family protein, partial [Chitinophagaceae bacterium]|nr:alginate export family protein [Chitinophagaceae bacterium]